MNDRKWIENELFEILNEANIIEICQEGTFVICSDLDSVQLISIIVEIEEKFNIEIPDQYLITDFLADFDHVVDVIEEILGNSTEVNCMC